MRADGEKVNKYDTYLEAPRRRMVPLAWLLSGAVILLLTAACLLAGRYWQRQADSRNIVVEAETIRTAAYFICLERAAQAQPLADPRSADGFADTAGQDILELAMASGQLWLLRTDNSGYYVMEFLYVQDGYAIHFINGSGDASDSFRVFRAQELDTFVDLAAKTE